jgi:hypothetical protein
MAKSIDPEVQALFDAGRVIRARAVAFYLDSGTLGLWTGEGSFVDAGVTYHGTGNSLLSSVPIASSLDGVPDGMELTLALELNGRFDPANTVTGIEQEPYNGRPMIVYDIAFHPDTMAMVGGLRRRWTGVIDTVQHAIRDGQMTVSVLGEMKTLFDMSRAQRILRSDATQRKRNPNDGFLRFASGVDAPIYLLRKTPKALAS